MKRFIIGSKWKCSWFLFLHGYLIEFLIRLLVKRNWMQAYFNISFEREAYENEKNLTYLRDRKFWFFLNLSNSIILDFKIEEFDEQNKQLLGHFSIISKHKSLIK